MNLTGSVFGQPGAGLHQVYQTGGTLHVSDSDFEAASGIETGSPVYVASGTIAFNGNTFAAPHSGSAPGLFIASDNAANNVSGNQFNGWNFTAPGTLGTYGPNTLLWHSQHFQRSRHRNDKDSL